MILQGDALEELKKLPDKCCSVCVTSPPYYNARDYGVADQLGTESSPEEYTRKLVEIFREVARVLKDDGTLWLNIGDNYARHIEDGGIKRKDLIGIPWLLALALRSDGWYLRADIIWNKPNAMPESAKDRPARSHEYVFLLSKAAAYYYDAEAVKELAVGYDPKPAAKEAEHLLEEMSKQPVQIVQQDPDIEKIKLETERDLYRNLYNELLSKTMKGASA